MNELKRASLVKPTLDTLYRIDFEWWSANDREWRVHLRSLLSEEEQAKYASIIDGDDLLDWVDPQTAEVRQIDGLMHILISHTAQEEGFLSPQTALVEAIFRLFLKHGNRPMSVNEIAEQLNRPGVTILKTLSGGRVYRGIRPILE